MVWLLLCEICAGSIGVSNSLTLLRLYGTALFDESPANRLKLAAELWEKYKECGKTDRQAWWVHDASCTQTCRALSIYKCTSHAYGTEVLLLIKETAKKKKSLMKVETMEIGKKWVKIKLGDWQCMHVCVCGNWYCTIIHIWSNCVGKLIWPTSLFFCNNCKCNCLFTVCWNYGDCQLPLRLLLTCWNLVLPEQGWTNCSVLYFRHTPGGGPLQHLAGCLQPEQIQVLSLRIPHQYGSQWCCSQPRMSLCLSVCLPLSVSLTVLVK